MNGAVVSYRLDSPSSQASLDRGAEPACKERPELATEADARDSGGTGSSVAPSGAASTAHDALYI